MTNRLRVLVPGVALLLALSGVAGRAQEGGAPTPAAARKPAPPLTKTPDGQPDLQGVWLSRGTFISIQDLEYQSLYQQPFKPNPALRGKSLVVDPPDGKIPYQPWAAAKAKVVLESFTDPTADTLDGNARCFLHGVPRQVNNREFEIFQPKGYVVILNMAHHAYRAIPLTPGPHIPENVKLFMGDSRGRWEGNTLLVDVTNQNDMTWFDAVGSFHSDALHVSERFTIVDSNNVTYEATLTDPKVYTRPWTFSVRFERARDYGELWEEACHENNEKTIELMLKR